VLLVGGWLSVRRRTDRSKPTERAPQPPAAASAAGAYSSIAVLPFRNLSGDSANDYFSDGISEEILNALTRLPGLRVIGRTSSFRFRGPDVDPNAVGKQLGVGVILSGSVQKAGDAVRVTAELVDSGTGYQLWSQKYDRRLQNLFELEDEISRSIADALRLRLAGGEAKPLVAATTSSPEAHNLFLRAKALALRPDETSLNEALRLYREALAHDPHYAAAWSGIADVYVWLGDAYRAPREVLPLARDAAERSIALDDSLASGHMALGTLALIWEWNFSVARKELERALALGPGVGMIHAYESLLLMTVDQDYARARAELEKAASLDPLNAYVPFYRLILASGEHDLPEAVRQATRVREIDRDFFYLLSPMVLAHMAARRWADCVADYKDLPEAVRREPQHGLAICLARLGDEKQARDILGRLEAESRTRYVDAALVGTVYAALGRSDEAFALFDRAYKDRSGGLLLMDSWPEYEPVRSDPRFASLRAKIGLPVAKERSQ
jgi:TolB-like protein